MNQAKKLSWLAQCLNTGLNVLGISAVASYNVWKQGGDLLILYFYGILFLGPLLFLAAWLLAPPGTFRANAAPRWMLLFNLGIGVLLLAVMLGVVFL